LNHLQSCLYIHVNKAPITSKTIPSLRDDEFLFKTVLVATTVPNVLATLLAPTPYANTNERINPRPTRDEEFSIVEVIASHNYVPLVISISGVVAHLTSNIIGSAVMEQNKNNKKTDLKWNCNCEKNNLLLHK